MSASPHFFRFKSFLLVLTIFVQFENLKGQSLSYRQGQLLVQFVPGFKPEINSFASISKRSNSLIYKTIPIKQLCPWNVWLIAFDYTRIRENELINDLKGLPEVLIVQKNHLIKPRWTPNDPYFTAQWYHVNSQNPFIDFDSDKAWDLAKGGLTDRGDTIVLCVIDDGLEIAHEDIRPNMWVNYREIEGNGIDDDQDGYIDDRFGWNTYKLNDLFDKGQHGTPVTGLAAAKGNNSLGISGICPNTKIMFVEGGGDEANAIEAYSYPFQLRRLYNKTNGMKGAFVVVTNTSWGSDYGHPEDAPLWCAVYDSLGLEGIVNVASTANLNIDVDIEGDLPTTCPSDYLITVTSLTDQNLRDGGAAYGKKSIDLGAYGESVFSTYINNYYRSFSGTSAAAPQVTGAVALIYSLSCSNLSTLAISNPPEAAREVKRIILNSVRLNDDLKYNTVSGGVLNLLNALNYSSPIFPIKITDHSIALHWDANAIFPIAIRYRIKSLFTWKDTTIYSGQDFVIDNLDACTEYEVQYKNICSRNTDIYSPGRIYKTSGCCDAPSNFSILNNTGNEVHFSFYDPDQLPLVGLLRHTGSTDWDTFVIHSSGGKFNLTNLDLCAQYEFEAYAYCNNKPTPICAPFLFNTNGCENCSDLNYCKRYKPSSDLEWLEAIQVNNTTFRSGNNLGYGNFVGSNQSWTFEKNKTYAVTFKAGYLNDTSQLVLAAWIDYNQDGNFDDNENFAVPTQKFSYSKMYQLSIPANAKSGLTRMRVCLKYAAFSETTPLPCFQSLEFGEYEDYCVTITNSICDDIESVHLNSAFSNQVNLTIQDPNSNSFIYGYRKLYSPDWILGIATSRQIQLNQLDSCSRYEIKLQSVCNDSRSNPVYFKFNTAGTGCISSTRQEDSERIYISPNPFTDHLYINNPDNIFISTLILYTVEGKSIRTIRLNSNESVVQLDCNINPGYYLLQLQFSHCSPKIYPVISIH